MANNYTESSFMVTGATQDIEVLVALLGTIADCLDSEDVNTWLKEQEETGGISAEMAAEVDNVLVGADLIDYGSLGFAYSQENETGVWIRHDESINPDAVAEALQAWLRLCKLETAIAFTWASGCSKARLDEFDGGGLVVTKDAMHWTNGYAFTSQVLAGLNLGTAKEQMYGTDAERLAVLEAFIDAEPELRARLAEFIAKKHSDG